MNLPRIWIAPLVLTTLGWPQTGYQPRVQLKEESLHIEYTVNSNEATVVVAAESEIAIQQLEVRGPAGQSVLGLHSNHLIGAALQSFVVETREEPLFAILSSWAPGPYELLARTSDGRTAYGGARLSHEVPAAPVISYPQPGAQLVPREFMAQWQRDRSLIGYTVKVSQGHDDLLSAQLPPDVHSFRIPAGVLAPGLPTFLEVGAIAVGGNRTLLEIEFEVE